MKNLHLCSQSGAVLSIELILLAIIAIAASIMVMTTAMDILPVLHDYLHSWVTDYAQSIEAAITNFCTDESAQFHSVADNDAAGTKTTTGSTGSANAFHNYGSSECLAETATGPVMEIDF